MNKSILLVGAIALGTLTACGTNAVSTNSAPAKETNAVDASSGQQTQYPLTLTDAAGQSVTLPKEPQHIVSATEGTDEILTALVPKEKLSAVTNLASDPTYSNVVSLVQGIPQIKDANAEQIIAFKPDLVLLASYTKKGVVDQIKQANIPVYEFSDFNSISDIQNNIQVVGKLVGNAAKAKEIVQSMNDRLQQIADAVKDQKKLKVLDYSSYGFAGGSGTTVNDIIQDAGGINAAADIKGWNKITDEEIVKLNPDVIIDAKNDGGFVEKILNDPGLQNVSAVKNKRVYGINDADLSSVSQSVVKGVEDVAQVLYPTVKLK